MLDPRDPTVPVTLTPDAEKICGTCALAHPGTGTCGRYDFNIRYNTPPRFRDCWSPDADVRVHEPPPVVLNAPTERVLAEFAKDEAIERARCVKAHAARARQEG